MSKTCIWTANSISTCDKPAAWYWMDAPICDVHAAEAKRLWPERVAANLKPYRPRKAAKETL